MSKVLGTQTYLVPTVVGAFAVKTQLVADYDVEDIVRNRSISQARMVQMINTGNTIAGSSAFPQDSLPVAFQQNTELSNG